MHGFNENRKMEIVRTVSELESLVKSFKQAGKTIGLVPTMGALHAGHESLVVKARKENDIVIVSVFVNPTQFNNKQDLATYPRTEERDCALLAADGCDVAFVPTVEEIYPEPDTRVFDLGQVAEVMEGKYRPGHCQQIVCLCTAGSGLFWRKRFPADCGDSPDGRIGRIQDGYCRLPDSARG